MSIRLLANAKINPTLRVLGRREDGFHELATTMLALDHGDLVSVSLTDAAGASAVVRGEFATPDVPTDGSNLAVRGAQLGADAVGGGPVGESSVGEVVAGGFTVDLEKRVPSRAGLGGGSADAAAAARAMAAERCGEEGCLDGRLAELGSDCAFFHGARRTGAALALGRGEEIIPLEAPADWWVALLTPEVECSTPSVYAALDAGPAPPTAVGRLEATAAARELFRLPALEARAALVNDLEAPARRAQPGLEPWFELLEREGAAHFRLAGSGSSFFGLFDGEAAAAEALARLESRAVAGGLGVRFSVVARPAGAALTTVEGGARG